MELCGTEYLFIAYLTQYQKQTSLSHKLYNTISNKKRENKID